MKSWSDKRPLGLTRDLPSMSDHEFLAAAKEILVLYAEMGERDNVPSACSPSAKPRLPIATPSST